MKRIHFLSFSAIPALALAAALPAFAQDAPAYVAPGTELQVGQPAIVPYLGPDGPELPVELTITAIEKGTPADLEGFNLPDDAADVLPVFVRYSYTNVGDEALTLPSVGSFIGIDDRGQRQMQATSRGGPEGGRITECISPTVSSLAKGESAEGCLWFALHKDAELAAAAYQGRYRHVSGEDYNVKYPLYNNPVRWVPATGTAADAPGGDGTIQRNN